MNLEIMKGRLAHDRRGASAIVFAMCLMPMLLAIGFVIDFGMYLNQKAKVQHALDMAGLAAARHLRLNLTEDMGTVQSLAGDYFATEIANSDYISMNQVTMSRSGMRLHLNVDGTMPTSFMQLVGFSSLSLETDTEVVYGVPSKAEIALVLDTSTSMSVIDSGESEARIESLKTAAKEMIAILIDPASSIEVKMAIVPFSNRVNIGTDQSGASWLHVPPDETLITGTCPITSDWYSANCTRSSTSCSDDDVVGSCGTWDCTGVDTSVADRNCSSVTRTLTWHGCVQPRSEDYHLLDASYASEKIPGFVSSQARECASQVQPLTDNLDDLNRTVNTLAVRSETYIPSGLIWGLRMLSDQEPFAADESVQTFLEEGGVKSLVLMSDGANTLAPDPTTGEIADADITRADPNTRAICQTIKDAGVELFVVAYNIADSATTSLLRECASSETRFYAAASADQLKEVFSSITQQLSRDIAITG